jgi:hypothetical protein
VIAAVALETSMKSEPSPPPRPGNAASARRQNIHSTLSPANLHSDGVWHALLEDLVAGATGVARAMIARVVLSTARPEATGRQACTPLV